MSSLRMAGCVLGFAVACLASEASAQGPSETSRFNWTGGYAGLNAGYAWKNGSAGYLGEPGDGAGNVVVNDLLGGSAIMTPQAAPLGHSLDVAGAFAGVQLGYNWQLAKLWVVGFEADFQLAGVDGEAFTADSPQVDAPRLALKSEQSLDWIATLRARLGFLATERVMVFGTGGFAYGSAEAKSSVSNLGNAGAPGTGLVTPGTRFTGCAFGATCLAGSDKGTLSGWTVGGGVEWAFANNATLKVEYLHIDLADLNVVATVQNPAIGDAFTRANFDNVYDVVRGAISVKF